MLVWKPWQWRPGSVVAPEVLGRRAETKWVVAWCVGLNPVASIQQTWEAAEPWCKLFNTAYGQRQLTMRSRRTQLLAPLRCASAPLNSIVRQHFFSVSGALSEPRAVRRIGREGRGRLWSASLIFRPHHGYAWASPAHRPCITPTQCLLLLKLHAPVFVVAKRVQRGWR